MITRDKVEELIEKISNKTLQEVAENIFIISTRDETVKKDAELMQKARDLPEEDFILFLKKKFAEKEEQGIFIAKDHHEKKVKEYGTIKEISELENVTIEEAGEILSDIKATASALAVKKIANLT